MVDRWFHPTRLLEYWFILIPLLLAAGLLAAWWIDRRADSRRERELVQLCHGSRAQAENLLAVEMATRPGITRALARESLIRRLRGSGAQRRF